MKTFVVLLVLMCASLNGLACTSSANTATEGDRLTLAQTRQANSVVHAKQQLAIGLLTLDVPKIAEAVEVLREMDQPLADIRDNTAQLEKNFGPPQTEPKPYSPDASKEAREQSAKEHGSKWWFWTALGIVGTWLIASPWVRNLPYIGPVVSFFAPNATKQDALTKTLQVGIEEGRNELDVALAKLQADGKISPEIAALIPSGDTLKSIVERELNRRGLLALNTKVYEKNPAIPEPPAATPA